MTKKTRILVTGIIVAVAVAFMPLLGGVSAATKKPAKPKITSATVSDYTYVTVKWKKAKNAKKYQVGIQSKKKWVKIKTVKKNAKNKKKYTKKNKYKVKAKGKKYIVYQYKHTYKIANTTTKLSYKFGTFEDYINYGTKYTFAVRSVNGKKYSAWATVTRTTGVLEDVDSDNEPITEPGAEVPVTIGGTKNTLIIGQETTYNIPDTTGLNTKMTSVNIIPKSVEVDKGEGADGKPYESMSCEGTINGIPNGYYSEVNASGVCGRGFSAPWDQEDTEYGYSLTKGWSNQRVVKVTDPNTKVYWTLDGTEPAPGQEDLTVAGSEYPLGTLKRGRIYCPEPETIKIRGTVSNGETEMLFEETMANYINACVWIKAYHGSNLVGIYYHETADEQFWPYGDELW